MPDQAVEGGGQTQARPLSEIEQLAQEIMAAREKALNDKIGPGSKREIMWFGDVHNCDRHNFYSMAAGDERTRWNAWVQAKLDAGREWEQITKRELSLLGYEPMLAGQVVEIKENGRVIARGRTDLSLRRQGGGHRAQLYPVEMKQMQPHVFEAIHDWRDMLRSPWYVKYARQLQLYMHGTGAREGLFLLGDFQGHWKILTVTLDEEFVQDVLAKIKVARSAADRGEAPPRIEYDPGLCGSCQFAHVCIPDIKSVPAQRIEGNTKLGELLERREQIADKAREYKRIDDAIKAFFDSVKEGVFTVGNFIITRKAGQRKQVELPDDVKAKYTVVKTTYKNNVERFQTPDPETIYLGPTKRLFDLSEET